jgi:hypothetical protein
MGATSIAHTIVGGPWVGRCNIHVYPDIKRQCTASVFGGVNDKPPTVISSYVFDSTDGYWLIVESASVVSLR